MSRQHKITTIEVRELLHQYIEAAQENKIKALFAMLKEEIKESTDHWNNAGLMAELEKREKSYRNGKAKLVTIDQAIVKARVAIKKVKNK